MQPLICPDMRRIAKEKMYQFAWRPRPPSLLSREQEDDILKNLKRYTKKFEEEDASIMSQARPDTS